MNQVEFPSREVAPGFLHHRVARGEEFQVSYVELDGTIPGHDAVSKQVLVVVAGRVVCATRDDEIELGVGEAVEWQEASGTRHGLSKSHDYC